MWGVNGDLYDVCVLKWDDVGFGGFDELVVEGRGVGD